MKSDVANEGKSKNKMSISTFRLKENFNILGSQKKNVLTPCFPLIYTHITQQVLESIPGTWHQIISRAEALLFLNLAAPSIFKMCLLAKQIKAEVLQNKLMG